MPRSPCRPTRPQPASPTCATSSSSRSTRRARSISTRRCTSSERHPAPSCTTRSRTFPAFVDAGWSAGCRGAAARSDAVRRRWADPAAPAAAQRGRGIPRRECRPSRLRVALHARRRCPPGARRRSPGPSSARGSGGPMPMRRLRSRTDRRPRPCRCSHGSGRFAASARASAVARASTCPRRTSSSRTAPTDWSAIPRCRSRTGTRRSRSSPGWRRRRSCSRAASASSAPCRRPTSPMSPRSGRRRSPSASRGRKTSRYGDYLRTLDREDAGCAGGAQCGRVALPRRELRRVRWAVRRPRRSRPPSAHRTRTRPRLCAGSSIGGRS